MARRGATKRIPRSKSDPAYYAARLEKLRSIYNPSFRARKRFSPQQKSAITRKWNRDARKAAAIYSIGIRKPPRKMRERIVLPPPVRIKRIRRPRKPPRIKHRRVLDTTIFDMKKQTMSRIMQQLKRIQARGQGARFLINVPKSPSYPKGRMASMWYALTTFSDAGLQRLVDQFGPGLIEIISATPKA